MKYVFLINGNASGSKSKEALEGEINRLKKPIDYSIYETKAPKDATKFVKEYQTNGENTCFVACGGDGTINEVASGLVNEPTKFLAILAYGSGNDFIKYYKGKDFKSVEKLVGGGSKQIDILKINDEYSINVCNFGFDAVVGSTANKVKNKGGKNPYTKGIIKAILTARYNKINVEVDGEKISKKRMLLCTLANCNYVGGQYNCAPKSTNDDGLIDVCLFHTMSLFGFLKILKPYTNGQHLDNPKYAKRLVYKQAKHVVVTADKPIELCLDGEMLGGTHFDVSILPLAVNIIIPKD